MFSASKVYIEPQDVNDRLAELELNTTILNAAALQGLAGWASCTLNHPPTYAGTVAWAETTRALREGLFSGGWMRQNEANLPLVINATGTVAIAVASGDGETGNKDGFPCTRSARGPKTAEVVRLNRQQLILDFGDPPAVIESIDTLGRSTWLFLVYRDLATRLLRIELSRPISMNKDGWVDEWAERIILDFIPFGEEPQIFNNNDADQSPEITVDIKRLG